MDGAWRVTAISRIDCTIAIFRRELPAFFLAYISLHFPTNTDFAPKSRTLNQDCARTRSFNSNCTMMVHTTERLYGADSDWPS